MAASICDAEYTLILVAGLDCHLAWIDYDAPSAQGDPTGTGADDINRNQPVPNERRIVLEVGPHEAIYAFEYYIGILDPNTDPEDVTFTATNLNAELNQGNQLNSHIVIDPYSLVPGKPDLSGAANEIKNGTLSYTVTVADGVVYAPAGETNRNLGANDQVLNGTLILNTGKNV